MYWIVRGALWFGAYLTLILFPLVVAAVMPGDAGHRPFATQFGIACGFVGLSVMAFEYALISKVKTVAGAFGQDALLQFHKLMGMLAAGLLTVHAFLMIRSGYPLEWLNPFDPDCPWAMRWGVSAAYLLVVLILLSLFRRKIHLAYGWWQLTHAWIADIVVVMGLTHVLLFGGFSATPAMRATLAVCYVILISLGVWFKLIRPIRMWSRPWEVVENREERGDSRTLILRPRGHQGLVFEPGQFAWLNTGRTPFHRDRHPISFSSCAYDEKGADIGFTIRNLGDWSGQTVPELQPGRTLWVDGPYGVFSADRDQGMGYVLIGGGVGITPMMSICSTLAERGDPRSVLLFFASREVKDLTFAGEFESLQKRMNLRIVYVIENPDANWSGERRFLTREILRKYLPPQYRRFQYFICGPVPMMDAMEKALPALGIPPEQIHTERFDMV